MIIVHLVSGKHVSCLDPAYIVLLQWLHSCSIWCWCPSRGTLLARVVAGRMQCSWSSVPVDQDARAACLAPLICCAGCAWTISMSEQSSWEERCRDMHVWPSILIRVGKDSLDHLSCFSSAAYSSQYRIVLYCVFPGALSSLALNN